MQKIIFRIVVEASDPAIQPEKTIILELGSINFNTTDIFLGPKGCLFIIFTFLGFWSFDMSVEPSSAVHECRSSDY